MQFYICTTFDPATTKGRIKKLFIQKLFVSKCHFQNKKNKRDIVTIEGVVIFLRANPYFLTPWINERLHKNILQKKVDNMYAPASAIRNIADLLFSPPPPCFLPLTLKQLVTEKWSRFYTLVFYFYSKTVFMQNTGKKFSKWSPDEGPGFESKYQKIFCRYVITIINSGIIFIA